MSESNRLPSVAIADRSKTVRNTLLLMAPQTGSHHEPFEPECIAERMVELAERVELTGQPMRFLAPDGDSTASPRLQRITEAVAKLDEGCLFFVRVEDPSEEYHLLWPKDALQDYGSFRAVADSALARRIGHRLGPRKTRVSGLCEGGLMVRAGEVILISSAMSPKLREELPEAWERFVLPEPFASDRYRKLLGPYHCRKTHLDLDISLLRTPENRFLLLVAELYFRVYEESIRRLVDSLAADLFVVPREEVSAKALNSVFLSSGSVLIPASCRKTRELLVASLGTSRVIPVEIDQHFDFNGGAGGLGCMSTLVSLAHVSEID